MKQEEFVKAIAYLGMAYNKEYSQAETMQMYDFLKEYNYQTFTKAIKNIIKTSKFVPKIADLIEECENCKSSAGYEVVEYMNKCGYFKRGYSGIDDNGNKFEFTIDDEHAERNYNKAIMWLEQGTVPSWLQEDINRYYRKMDKVQLQHEQNNLLT